MVNGLKQGQLIPTPTLQNRNLMSYIVEKYKKLYYIYCTYYLLELEGVLKPISLMWELKSQPAESL